MAKKSFEKRLEDLEKTLTKALEVFEEMEELDQRLKGSDHYPKDVRAEMQFRLLDKIKTANKKYNKLKIKYEKDLHDLQQEDEKPRKSKDNPVH